MKILKKEQVTSLPLSHEALDILYGNNSQISIANANDDYSKLKHIIDIFKTIEDGACGKYQCFIERKAFNAFVAFADEAYKNHGHEATGVIFGYYFHLKDNPEKKIVIATDFLPANGPATAVTCTISYDDVIRYSNFCEKNKMVQTVWIHSHPGYGIFYSGTDSAMLSSTFYANHQMGVVIDNLKNQAMGFKIINGVERHADVLLFDLEESLRKNQLQTQILYHEQVAKPNDIRVKSQELQTAPDQGRGTLNNATTNNISAFHKKKEETKDEIARNSPQKVVINSYTKSFFAYLKNEIYRPLSFREVVFLAIALLSLIIYTVQFAHNLWPK